MSVRTITVYLGRLMARRAKHLAAGRAGGNVSLLVRQLLEAAWAKRKPTKRTPQGGHDCPLHGCVALEDFVCGPMGCWREQQ